MLTERRFSLDEFRYIRIHTWFRGLGEIKIQADKWPYNQGGLSPLWAGGTYKKYVTYTVRRAGSKINLNGYTISILPQRIFWACLLERFHNTHTWDGRRGGRVCGGGWVWGGWNESGINSTHRMCKSGLVLWTSTSQTGQWNEVWRYFTIQLRQTANKDILMSVFWLLFKIIIHFVLTLHSHAIKNGVFRMSSRRLEMLRLAVSFLFWFDQTPKPDWNLTFLATLTYKEL